jgi:TonB family protein
MELQRGTTVVEFEIKIDGSLGKIRTIKSSGLGSLDNIAKQAIVASAPFARVPKAASKKTLRLQMFFGYNQPSSPDAPVCDGLNWGARSGKELHRVGSGVKPPHAVYSPDPEFSEEARRDKYESEVTIAGTVDEQGAFTDLCLVQAAGAGLDEKAMNAVRTWNFEPATLQGQPVAVRIVVETTFRLY